MDDRDQGNNSNKTIRWKEGEEGMKFELPAAAEVILKQKIL